MSGKVDIGSVEVSAKSRFGRPSEMDIAIKSWTKNKWTLVETIPGKGDKYLLRFERERSKAPEEKRGCSPSLVIIGFFAVLVAISIVNRQNDERNAAQVSQRIAQTSVQSTALAIANLTTWTPSPAATDTSLPSDTPLPTRTPRFTQTPVPTETFTSTRVLPTQTPTSTETSVPSRTVPLTATETPVPPTATNTFRPTATRTSNTNRGQVALQVTVVTTSTPSSAQSPMYVVSSSSSINVRSCARVTCSVVGTYAPGEQFSIVDVTTGDLVSGNTNWLHLIYGGRDAYVHSSLATILNDEVEQTESIQVSSTREIVNSDQIADVELSGENAEELYDVFISNSFVENIETISVSTSRNQTNEYFVYITMRVDIGENRLTNVEVLFAQSEEILGTDAIDFTAILHACSTPIDYYWSGTLLSPEWIITPVNSVDLSDLCPSAEIRTATPTRLVVSRPTATTEVVSRSEIEDAGTISDTLFLQAGGRNVEEVYIADGHANGGERAAIITYLSTETTEIGLVDEFVDIFSAVAVSIRAYNIDLDTVMLVVGDAVGNAVGTVTVSVNDLMDFHYVRITRSQFLDRVSIMSF